MARPRQYVATFGDGTRMVFYAECMATAGEHAAHVARDLGKQIGYTRRAQATWPDEQVGVVLPPAFPDFHKHEED